MHEVEQSLEHSSIYSLLGDKTDEYIEGISIIAEETFRDGVNICRIAFFMAFVRNLMKERPDKKYELYEKTFECLYKKIQF